MIQITDKMIDDARTLIAKGSPIAIGYRLMIKPIEATTGLEQVEQEEFPTLAAANLEIKTEEQQQKESFGTQHGILVSVGAHAFKADALGGSEWAEEGDVVIFDRYAGVDIELPPGSGEVIKFANDESLLGKMEAKNV